MSKNMLETVHKNSFVSTFRFLGSAQGKMDERSEMGSSSKISSRLIDELLDSCSTLLIPASAHNFTAVLRGVVLEYGSRFARYPPRLRHIACFPWFYQEGCWY